MSGDKTNMYYYGLGTRDAIAELCALIRSKGLADGVRDAVKQLQVLNPENPHIGPVLGILEEEEKNAECRMKNAELRRRGSR